MTSFACAALLCLSLPCALRAQEKAPLGTRVEKLKASRIEGRSLRGLRALRPLYGIPVLSFNTGSYDADSREREPEILPTNVICGHSYAEKIGYSKRAWNSVNLDFDIPNWVAWDPDPFEAGDSLDRFSRQMAEYCSSDLRRSDPAFRPDSLLLALVLEECRKWALEKPVGSISLACGPLVRNASDCRPYEYFVVVCKRTGKALGYKSIGFLIPPASDASETAAPGTAAVNPYTLSTSVNTVEYKSGYDFFPGLPEGVQEYVEGMTTFELFCSYVEEAAYNEEPPDSDNDAMDALNDYLLDFYDR